MTAVAANDLTMGELLAAYPGAQRTLFRLYHVGGCASCGFSMEEKLSEVCARNDGLDPETVLEAVRAGWEEDKKLMIEPQEAQQLLQAGQARFVDIRTEEEFQAVHIEGSRRFDQPLMQEILSTWPKDEMIVLLDHQGARALDAAAYFAGHDFIKVRGLRGGIDAWSAEVDPSLPRYTLE